MVDSLDFIFYHILFVINCYRFYMIVSGEMEKLGKKRSGASIQSLVPYSFLIVIHTPRKELEHFFSFALAKR